MVIREIFISGIRSRRIFIMTGSCPGWWRRWVTLGLIFLLPATLAVLPALVAARDTQEAEARLSSARKLCQEKKYLAALDELQPLTTEASCPPLVSFYVGLAERGLGVQELSTGRGKPIAPRHFTNAAHHFAAAAQAFSPSGNSSAQGAEPSFDWEWAACSRCAQAEMLLRTGKTTDARDALASLLKDPRLTHSASRGLVLYYHGLAGFLLDDLLAAGRSFNQLAPFDDPLFGSHARYLLARVHHCEGECAEAIVHYEGVLADYETAKQRAADKLAQPETLQDNPTERSRLEALVAAPAPEHLGRATFYLGVLYYEAGRFNDAKACFTKVVAQKPASPVGPDAQLFRGFCEVRLQQFPEAIQTLQPISKGESSRAVAALVWLAKALVGTADPDDPDNSREAMKQALAALRQAAERASPEQRGAILIELAETQVQDKQYKEAVALFARLQAGRLLPDREELLQKQLTALNLAGAYEESDALCAQFHKTYPHSLLIPEVLFRHAENAFFRATTSDERARLAEAARSYQLVADKYPEFANADLARYGLAQTYYLQGDLEKAQKILETFAPAECTGELALAPYLLADCLIRLAPVKAEDALAAGRLQEQLTSAAELLNGLIGSQPDHPQVPDALLRLGLCQQRLVALMAPSDERNQMQNAARASFEKILLDYPLNDVRPQAALERARCIARTGDANEAINRLRAFESDPLRNHPLAPLALLQLATLLRGQDNKAPEAAKVMAQCRKRYEKTLLRDPDRTAWVPLLQYHHAVALQEAGQLAEARALFDAVNKQFSSRPEAAEAVLHWGQCLRDEGLQKIDQANQLLGMPDLKPSEAAAARKTLDEGRAMFQKAIQYFEKQAEQWERKDPASEMRARLLYQAIWGYRALGDQEVEAVRTKSPEGPRAQVDLQPSEKKAAALYEVLFEAFPDLPLTGNARLELAEMRADRGDLSAAIQLLKDALDKEPSPELTDRIRMRLAACHLARGDGAAGVAQFEAVARNADSPLAAQAHYRAADYYWNKSDWSAAEKHLAVFRDVEAFQKVDGLSDVALLRLGHLLSRQQKAEEARAAYDLVLERFGGDGPWAPEARYALGCSWLQAKEYDKAIAILGEIPADPPTEAYVRAQVLTGICQMEQKHPEAALATLTAVAAKSDFPEASALALLEAARAAQQLDLSAEAEKFLQQVDNDYPDTPWAEAARKALSPDNLLTPAHELSVAVRLLTPAVKGPGPLEPQGPQQPEFASLDDPTEPFTQAAILARKPPSRQAPAPWLRLTLPDPFEHQRDVRLESVPPEEMLPAGDELRLPQP
jgi:TolA-binding protein